jgi:predicted DCC family thiol-disulfide oxidoreductase YuxK
LSLTVLYDADCGICRHTARTLRALDRDRQLRLAPLQDYAPRRADDPSIPDLLARLHVHDDRGTWASGGAAFLRVAAQLPLLRPLAIAGRLPGAGMVVEAAYDLVAGHRQQISRWLDLDHCQHRPRPATPSNEAA